jgi:hypothetical protein
MEHTVMTHSYDYGAGPASWQCSCGARGSGRNGGARHLQELASAELQRACWDALREANGVSHG